MAVNVVGKIDLRYDMDSMKTLQWTLRPLSGQAAVGLIAWHTRHLAVVSKHYTAALQTTETSGAVVLVV